MITVDEFRAEVREWLADNLVGEYAALKGLGGPGKEYQAFEERLAWNRLLAAAGLTCLGWPVEHGGRGLTVAHRVAFYEEYAKADAPDKVNHLGEELVGPTLIAYGTTEQQQRFLPAIRDVTELWCQGYSEPGAGSDLASLRTTAVDDGDAFVVNGQKTWTTYAQYADWIFALVRTDPSVKKQAGISFLLIDMKSPGVEARPMLTIGHTPAFCDTFFDNVRVPKANLLGPLHGGWTVAKALLGHERTLIAAVGMSQRTIRRVKRIAAATRVGGRTLLDDPAWRGRIARLEIKLQALQMANYRALAGAALGHAPGPESSILKLRGSEIAQQAFELAMDVMGPDALSWFNQPGVVPELEQWVGPSYCYNRATTIYGGSNEIQKNIIAKMILGLPGT